jgi:hypothetical protein
MSEDNSDQQVQRKNSKISEVEVIKTVNGIQVNHCMNPQCANFNVPYTGRADDPNYKQGGTVRVKPPLHWVIIL